MDEYNEKECNEIKKEFEEVKVELEKECCKSNKNNYGGHASSGAVYGLGFIGAAVYYISEATSFGMGLLGFFKAIVWPAFVIFDLMKHLGM